MVTETKKQEVEALRGSFNEASSAVFANFSGVDVAGMTALRKELRVSNSKLKVVKNTLARIAAKETPFECADDMFKGPISVAFGFGDDISAPAKVLIDFAKENANLEIIGGAIEGSLLDVNGVKELSKMPPKPVVQSMLLGLLQAPARNFLGVTGGVGRKLLYALNAIADKKKEE